MAKVTYASLKLKTDDSVKIFKINDTEIEVLKYLPIEDKYDLISITLQNSKENGIYNPIKLDMYFHLYLVYMYTNINFTDKQKENESKLYDTLKSNGIIDSLLDTIEESEYNDLISFMEEQVEWELKYATTAASLISKIVDDLPKNAQAAMDIVENFDKTKFQEVVDFAQAANGGRPI